MKRLIYILFLAVLLSWSGCTAPKKAPDTNANRGSPTVIEKDYPNLRFDVTVDPLETRIGKPVFLTISTIALTTSSTLEDMEIQTAVVKKNWTLIRTCYSAISGATNPKEEAPSLQRYQFELTPKKAGRLVIDSSWFANWPDNCVFQPITVTVKK